MVTSTPVDTDQPHLISQYVCRNLKKNVLKSPEVSNIKNIQVTKSLREESASESLLKS